MQNEQLLLAAARDLDEAALLTIFDRYAPKVYLHALRRTHDRALADDIVSRVFTQFLDELAQGYQPDNGPIRIFIDLPSDIYRDEKQAGKKNSWKRSSTETSGGREAVSNKFPVRVIQNPGFPVM